MSVFKFAKPLVEQFPKAATIYRTVRDCWPISGEPQETPFGFKLLGLPAMVQGDFEPVETKLAMEIIPSVDVVINIGANIGYYSCLALQFGKPVVAFEPIPRNVSYLLRNLKANGWSAEVYPIALSDTIGIAEIYGGGTGASLVQGWAETPNSYVTLVPASTADLILQDRFAGKRCFVVVDIEGAELPMLRGASRLLNAKPKAIWMVEICIGEHQPNGTTVNRNLLETFQMFWESGYEAFTADEERRPVRQEELSAIASGGPDTMKTHNFLFIEA